MFIVEAMMKEDFDSAVKLISKHNDVSYTVEKEGYTFILNVNIINDKVSLCQKDFENNWHQKHCSVCRVCKSNGETFCEHKTFKRPIYAYFD